MWYNYIAAKAAETRLLLIFGKIHIIYGGKKVENRNSRTEFRRKVRHAYIYTVHYFRKFTHPVYRWLNKVFSSEVMSLKMIWTLFIPLFADQVMIALSTVANTAVVGNAGSDAVSAVSMVDSINALPLQLIIGIALGCTVVVAQCIGQGNREKAGLATCQAITSSTFIATVIALAMFIFAEPLINLMFGGAEKNLLDLSVYYLRGISVSLPFYAIAQTVSNALRGMGNPKISMIFSAGVSMLNILFNIVLILGFKMGILGLILSLLAARLIGTVASLLYLVKCRPEINLNLKSLLKIDFSMQKSLMMIGIPSASENLFFNGGRLICQVFYVQMGSIAINANAISNSLTAFYLIMGSTFANLVIIVCGQCVGAGKFEIARKYIYKFTFSAAILAALVELALYPFMNVMIMAYNPLPDAVDLIRIMLICYCIAHPIIWPFGFIVPSGLRAGGDATFTSVTALSTMWVVRVVLGYLFGIVFEGGANAIWIAMYIEWSVRAVIFIFRSRGKKWYAHKVV